MMKPQLLLIAPLILMCSTTALAGGKTKFGISVDECRNADMDITNENFCSDANMRKFAQVMKTQKANFDKTKILYLYKSKASYNNHRAVVIDPKLKKAYTTYYAFEVPSVSAFSFSKDSNKFCVKGAIIAYRSTQDYDPEYYPNGFCFELGSEGLGKAYDD